MGRRARFALALVAIYLGTLVVPALAALALWLQWSERQRAAAAALASESALLLVVAGLAPVLVLGVLFEPLYQRFISAPRQLLEGARIILSANPSHRLAPSGNRLQQELAGLLNEFAVRGEELQRDLGSRVAQAQHAVGEERDRLAALVSELPQSVVVCNGEGRILLYNSRARQLLSPPDADPRAPVAGACLVGLGRSIFGVFERNLVAHALESIEGRIAKGEVEAGARFVTAAPGGQLIRVHMAPVLGAPPAGEGATREVTGFVLLLDDVTRAMERGGRTEVFLRSLTEASRRAVGNIRAAAETLLAFPGMEPERQTRFVEVVVQEATGLGARLDGTAAEHAESLRAEWAAEDMLGADLVVAAAKRIDGDLGMATGLDAVDGAIWLRVDSYLLVQALTCLARRLRDELGVREVRLRLEGAGRLVHLDLAFGEVAVGPEALAGWETRPLDPERLPLSLQEVAERHDGEAWHRTDRATGTGLFRLLLPVARSTQAPHRAPARVAPGRPEYYDFDLFHQSGQTPELDQRRLADLAYTVFDTETTGLDPSGGDEIIAVGALRIVNGRLLHHEAFEQLVDPRRPMSAASIRITGIDPAILEGQPTIDAVLPQFHRYCEDSVLVAHNAGFDMRFLQLKEERTGVRFTQPVLDTLLLSAVLHPGFEANSLEAIAARLGVALIGRHTALGDAILTGEIFLKMIPLLAAKGLVTLKDARDASERTFHARLKY